MAVPIAVDDGPYSVSTTEQFRLSVPGILANDTYEGVVGEDWQLDAGHYVSTDITGMLPTITFPRPNSETLSGAYCRNAYPGMKWEIPIIVQGGSWPFKYELTNSSYVAGSGVEGVTHPNGMSIGETLTVSGDTQIVGEDYGVLSWTSPSGTTETIYLIVTDQDGNVATLELTITIGTSNFVFIDGDAASEGVGTIGDPLKTFGDGLFEGNNDTGSLYQDKVAVFRNASTPYSIEIAGVAPHVITTRPATYIAYPGEQVTFDMSQITVTDTFSGTWIKRHDVFYGGIDFDGYVATTPNWRCLWLSEKWDRSTFFKLTFDNMGEGADGGDNPSCIVTWGIGNTTEEERRKHINVSRCTLRSNIDLPLFETYDSDHVVAEHNVCSMSQYNDHAKFIFFKDHTSNFSIRRNTCILHNTTGTAGSTLLSSYGSSSDGVGDTFSVNQEICWNVTVVSDPEASREDAVAWDRTLADNTTNKHDYRNTVMVQNTAYGFYGNTDEPGRTIPQVEGNVIYGASRDVFGDDGVAWDDNGNQYLEYLVDTDADGNLTGASRVNFLGTFGYEVA